VLRRPGEIHAKVFSEVAPTSIPGIYGDGKAAQRIARILVECLRCTGYEGGRIKRK